tara:strand:+ start:71 stop:310 length:240 start_codon:yes stop_codon:yes gene_type:complete
MRASSSEIARQLAEVASLAVLAQALFKRIDRRGYHSRAWDVVWEDLGNATESLEDLQEEIRSQTTGAVALVTLSELLAD